MFVSEGGRAKFDDDDDVVRYTRGGLRVCCRLLPYQRTYHTILWFYDLQYINILKYIRIYIYI